jgi:hypothetical protein
MAGFLSGFLSIVVWPGVAVLGIKSIGSAGLGISPWSVAALLCLAATYSATFFIMYFIVIPLRAVHWTSVPPNDAANEAWLEELRR